MKRCGRPEKVRVYTLRLSATASRLVNSASVEPRILAWKDSPDASTTHVGYNRTLLARPPAVGVPSGRVNFSWRGVHVAVLPPQSVFVEIGSAGARRRDRHGSGRRIDESNNAGARQERRRFVFS